MNTTNDIKGKIEICKLLIECARLRNEITLLPDVNIEECKEKEEVLITDECSQFLVSGELAQLSSHSDF
jgi:AMMECR1 domain-containing protein